MILGAGLDLMSGTNGGAGKERNGSSMAKA